MLPAIITIQAQMEEVLQEQRTAAKTSTARIILTLKISPTSRTTAARKAGM